MMDQLLRSLLLPSKVSSFFVQDHGKTAEAMRILIAGKLRQERGNG